MRKSILSMSIAAMIGGLGLAGGASAAVLGNNAATATSLVQDGTGIGHILVVPYFSTQNGNVTTLNLVNTDSANGKLVKIRFRGASNSDDLFDFQVFLSPSDVWTASISADATTGISAITTADNSCTLPTVKGAARPFGTGRLNTALTGDALASETREGYIEIINSADVPQGALAGQGTLAAPITVNPLYTAIKHVSGTAPCTAAALNATLKDPTIYTSLTAKNAIDPIANVEPGSKITTGEFAASTMGLTLPSGGLFANSIIVNVPNTTTFPSEAVALKAVTNAGVSALGNLVHSPQIDAALTGGLTYMAKTAIAGVKVVADSSTADPLLRTLANTVRQPTGSGTSQAQATLPVVKANYLDFPDMSTPYTVLGADPAAAGGVATAAGNGTAAVSAVNQAALVTATFATQSVSNEILGDTSIAAKTDWVFSMPTRRYNVAMNYKFAVANPVTATDGRVFTNYDVTAPLDAAVALMPYFTTANTAVSNGQICLSTLTSTSYDREETGAVNSTAASFSPPGPTAATVLWCGETSVLSVNAGSNTATSVLGAKVARQNVNTTTGLDGWMTITTPQGEEVVGAPTYPTITQLKLGVGGAPAVLVPKGLPVIGSAYIQAANPAARAGVSGTYGVRSLHRFVR